MIPFAPLPAVRHRVAVIAHRGGCALAPEGTLAAFENAIRLGVDFIEVDVHPTRDGRIVVSHDSTVDRTTDGSGKIADLDFAAIRALDAGSKFDARYAGERIPTLDEVLDLAGGRVNVYLDHKEGRVSDVLAPFVRRGLTGRLVVYSGVRELQEWKALTPGIPVMPSLPRDYRRKGGIGDFLKVLPAEVLDGNTPDYTAALVQEAHAAGMKIYVDSLGGADNAAGWQRAIDLAVDGIQTDRPDALIAFLRA